MNERKDIDQKRIAVLGHSEGGWVAMLAAAKDKHIAALVLVATIGVTGAELNMEQVTHALDRAKKTDPERQTTLDLQKQIQTAVLTGKGWDTIPPMYRKQADTPWFQSFLAFDPAKLMPDVRQPVLDRAGDARHAGAAGQRRPARGARARAQERADGRRGESAGHQSPAAAGDDRRVRRIQHAHRQARESGADRRGHGVAAEGVRRS